VARHLTIDRHTRARQPGPGFPAARGSRRAARRPTSPASTSPARPGAPDATLAGRRRPGNRRGLVPAAHQSALVTIAIGRYPPVRHHRHGRVEDHRRPCAASPSTRPTSRRSSRAGASCRPPGGAGGAGSPARSGVAAGRADQKHPTKSPKRSWPTPAWLSCSSRSCPPTRLGGSSPPPSPTRWPLTPSRAGRPVVAAHRWDVAGALAAGCRAAFGARPDRLPTRSRQRPT
jgi:hypothetical protein